VLHRPRAARRAMTLKNKTRLAPGFLFAEGLP
jgi:hypothetical protein